MVEKCIATSGTSPRRRPNLLSRRRSLPIQAPVGRQSLNEFKYSERYNLTRLSDEEAEARRKKLEEEGH